METSISNILKFAEKSLVHSKTPKLDAEVLLCFALKVSRAYLYTYPDKKISKQKFLKFQNLIRQRKKRIPIAYITGHKEFWSLDFLVNKNTLIPRPETETLVECVLSIFPEGEKKVIADLGTGCGAIALSIAKERPRFKIVATDYSKKTINVAKKNFKKLKLKNVKFFVGDLTKALPKIKFDAIVSNPPYVAKKDLYKPCFEPKKALVARDNGLLAIKNIIVNAKKFLKSGGYLIIEHGANQGKSVRELLLKNGYKNVITEKDLASHERMSYARFVIANCAYNSVVVSECRNC